MTPLTYRGKPIELTNLRVRRLNSAPDRSWTLEAGEITAHVQQKNVLTLSHENEANLEVKLDIPEKIWSLDQVEIASPKGGARLQPPLHREFGRGPKSVTVHIELPNQCEVSKPRVEVVLSVKYRVGDQIKTQRIELDHSCLLGDTLETRDANGVAKLVQKNKRDPILQKLVQRARSLPALSLDQALSSLRTWTRFQANRDIQSDPADLANGWKLGTAYALSPTETLRYGGDCEDWTILIGGYLSLLGFKTAVAFAPGHVWIRVLEKGRWIDIDWVGQPAADGFETQSL